MSREFEWAVGVTTVPSRASSALPATLECMHRAGWPSPRLFVDGDDGAVWYEKRFGLEATRRSGKPANVAANWFLSLCELYWRQPHADRYLLVQDDVGMYKNLRQYLEISPYPHGSYLNLYTQRFNDKVVWGVRAGTWVEAQSLPPSPKIHRDTQGRWQQGGKGALALCFDMAAIQALLSSPHMVSKPADKVNGWRSIDGAVVEAMNRAGFREFVHSPSLVQHRGKLSTILLPSHEDGTLAPKQRSPSSLTYMGDSFDALTLLQESQCASESSEAAR
jgi:hypothetical protein